MDPKPPDIAGKIEEKESITMAAIRVETGQVFSGVNHNQIINEIYGVDAGLLQHRESGFITSTDRFVNRKEAAKIAFASGQIKEEVVALTTEALNEGK